MESFVYSNSADLFEFRVHRVMNRVLSSTWTMKLYSILILCHSMRRKKDNRRTLSYCSDRDEWLRTMTDHFSPQSNNEHCISRSLLLYSVGVTQSERGMKKNKDKHYRTTETETSTREQYNFISVVISPWFCKLESSSRDSNLSIKQSS